MFHKILLGTVSEGNSRLKWELSLFIYKTNRERKGQVYPMNNFLKRTLSLIMAVALFFTAIPLQTIVSAVDFTLGTKGCTVIG